VSGEYTTAQREMLAAQAAHFASDDHVRREVEIWRDATPEQRLAELAGMCAMADHFLSRLDADTLDRVLTPQRLPDDAIAALVALRKLPR
jgi:hypothetical protein